MEAGTFTRWQISLMTNEELIKEAERALNPRSSTDGRVHGDVGAALVSDDGNLYTGVCVDTPSWGLCAERSAIASMITNKEYKIKRIVAVWRNEKTGKLHVLPPCGYCRQFMRDIDESNMNAEVILGREETKELKELLPNHEWPEPLE